MGINLSTFLCTTREVCISISTSTSHSFQYFTLNRPNRYRRRLNVRILDDAWTVVPDTTVIAFAQPLLQSVSIIGLLQKVAVAVRSVCPSASTSSLENRALPNPPIARPFPV